MHWVVSYDITDDGARRKALETLKDYGTRVQDSVFECELDESGVRELTAKLAELVTEPNDSCRFYRVCADCRREVVILGRGDAFAASPAVVIV